MDVDDLIREFKKHDSPYPRAALEEAIQKREEITPELLKIIRETIDSAQDVIDRYDYKLCIYSMYLLAQFREKKAYPIIIEFLSMPEGKALGIVGDMFIEDIGRILASVACGDTNLLKQLIENSQAHELIRSCAIEALLVMIRVGEANREETIEYFRELFRRRLERKPSVVWDCLVSCAIDLHPGDLYDEIDQAYEDYLVNESIVDQDKIYEAMDLEQDQVMETFFEGAIYTLITDVIQEMEEMTQELEEESFDDFD